MDQVDSQKKGKGWMVLTVVFILLFAISLFTRGFSSLSITGSAVLSQDSAKTKANDFIQKYIANPGVTIKIDDIKVESGLYALNITASANGQTQSAKAYVTKDGKLFFLQAIPLDNVDELLKQQQAAQAQQVDIQPTVEQSTTSVPKR